MIIEIIREEPKPPPVTEIRLNLTVNEARILHLLGGSNQPNILAKSVEMFPKEYQHLGHLAKPVLEHTIRAFLAELFNKLKEIA